MNGRIQRFTREKGGEKGGKSGFFFIIINMVSFFAKMGA